MDSTELLALFRDEMSDVETPHLWSDALVYSYIDDAQKMFCRKTDGIPDASTAAVTELQVDDTTTWLDTHPSILKIRGATRNDTGAPVKVINAEDMPTYGLRFNGAVGPVQALVVGMQNHRVRVYPDSNEVVQIDLLVFRLPLEAITDEGEQELEVDEQHHRHLLLWAKALAYGKQDAETFDKTKKREFENDFLAYCAEVKKEQGRARHKPRLIAYGGI